MIIMADWLCGIFRTLMISAIGFSDKRFEPRIFYLHRYSIHFLVSFKLSDSRSDMWRDEYYCERRLATTEPRQLEVGDEWRFRNQSRIRGSRLF